MSVYLEEKLREYHADCKIMAPSITNRMENSFDSLSVLRCLLDKENKTKTSRANFLHHAIEFLVEEQTKDLLQEKTMKFPSHWRKSVLI